MRTLAMPEAARPWSLTAKKTKAFVESLQGKLRLFFLPPYSRRVKHRLIYALINSIDTNIVAFAIDDWNNPAKVLVVMRAMSRTGCLKVVAYVESKLVADALAKRLSDD